jgi:hypothetical protein
MIAVVAATFFTWLLRQLPDAWVTFLVHRRNGALRDGDLDHRSLLGPPRLSALPAAHARPVVGEGGRRQRARGRRLACAVFLGVAGNRHFPWWGLEGQFWYLPTILAWLTALGLYMAGVALVRGRPDASGGSVTPSRGATPSTGAWSTATSRSTSPPAGAGAVRIVRHRPPARRPGAPCGALYGS